MTKRKYEKGKQIRTMAEFANSNAECYIVRLGGWVTKHRSFLENWQYGLLEKFTRHGMLYEAKGIGEE